MNEGRLIASLGCFSGDDLVSGWMDSAKLRIELTTASSLKVVFISTVRPFDCMVPVGWQLAIEIHLKVDAPLTC